MKAEAVSELARRPRPGPCRPWLLGQLELPVRPVVRGRTVKAPLVYGNWLIGAIPRQSKTAAVRALACAIALDPLVEMWVPGPHSCPFWQRSG